MNEAAVRGHTQPDQRSCGASTLVAARMLVDPSYADQVGGTGDGFARESLAMHRRVTGLVDVRGMLQLPWLRVIGTPPWAVARQMSALGGPDLESVDHDVHVVLGNRAELVQRMRQATAAGRPVPFYIGDRWLPRHVVLAVAPAERDGLRVYNPAGGRITDVRTAEFLDSRLPLGRWTRPWFVVLPDLD